MPSRHFSPDRLLAGIWKIACVAMLGSLMAQIDATVVNVSLSSLVVSLHSSLATIQWVTSGYLLAEDRVDQTERRAEFLSEVVREF